MIEMYVGVLNVTETLQYMALGLRKKSGMTERFPTRRINGQEKREESTVVYSEHERTLQAIFDLT